MATSDPWTKRKPRRLIWEGLTYPGSVLYEMVGIPDPMRFSYGQYCGASVVKNPGWRILSQDSIDDCCLEHDRCIEAHRGARYGGYCAHLCCDCTLFLCAALAYSNCSNDYPHPKDQSKRLDCMKASEIITKGFLGLCGGANVGEVIKELMTKRKCPKCISSNDDFMRYLHAYWGDPTSACPQGVGS